MALPTNKSALNAAFAERLKKIEAVLSAALPAHPDDSWMEAVFALKLPGIPETPGMPAPLLAPCVDLLGRGGKRWRPLLAEVVCESLGGGGAALPLVPLVEFCHNASLIHDDIEDNSPERRGKPACHILYGQDAAINSGAFFYFLPSFCVDRWDAPERAKLLVYSLWALNMRRLHLGQSMDIEWHRTAYFPGIDEYFTMCRLKTGSAAAFAVQLGLLASNPAGWARDGFEKRLLPESNPLVGAAEKLGLGFQILDDVKNLTGGIAGKKRGDDIVEGKKSLPVVLFVNGEGESGRETRAAFVMDYFEKAKAEGTEGQAAAELIARLEKTGALAGAEAEGRRILDEAERALSADYAADFPPPAASGAAETESSVAEARRLLSSFVGMLVR